MYESMVRPFQHYYVISETLKIFITTKYKIFSSLIFSSGKQYSNKVIPTEFNMSLTMKNKSTKKYNFLKSK